MSKKLKNTKISLKLFQNNETTISKMKKGQTTRNQRTSDMHESSKKHPSKKLKSNPTILYGEHSE